MPLDRRCERPPNVLPSNCGLFYRHAELKGRAYKYLWNSHL